MTIEDPIAELCRLVKEAGLQVTLHGVAVTAEELRARMLEHAKDCLVNVLVRARAEGCTGVSASWCPVHGDCTCSMDEDTDGWDDPECPLHGTTSTHAEKPDPKESPMIVQEGTTKVEFAGRTSVEHNRAVLLDENDQGKVVIMLATGALVPENWIGKRVRVQVELISSDDTALERKGL